MSKAKLSAGETSYNKKNESLKNPTDIFARALGVVQLEGPMCER